MSGERTYKALIVGDVVGKCGRDAFEKALPELQWQLDVDFTLVNGENTSNGRGLNRRDFDFYRDLGADAVTLGNHLYGNREISSLLDKEERLARPANLPPATPGSPYRIVPCGDLKIAVLNLLGRVYMNMPALDCPFRRAEELLHEIHAITSIILVDFHAEATSEKLAMGYMLDGRISALWGTHTHVPTADVQVLPKGTGYVTDLGMTGPRDSVLGVQPHQSIAKFRGDLTSRYQWAKGPTKLEGVLFTIDTQTGLAKSAERVGTVYETSSRR